jgi:hypothetical protein
MRKSEKKDKICFQIFRYKSLMLKQSQRQNYKELKKIEKQIEILIYKLNRMTAKREATLYTLKERSKKCVKIIK